MHFDYAQCKQKGFAPIIVLVGLLVATLVVGSGYYFLKVKTPEQKACTMDAKICPDGTSVGRSGPNCEFAACPSPKPTSTSIPPESTDSAETANWRTYTSGQFRFSFRYPKNDYTLINDNEKQFSQRGNINDIKQIFVDMMKHEPPVVLGAVSIEPLNKGLSPFSIWIFENNEQISIDEWFNQYGYYPFHFGQAMKIVTEGPNKSIRINNYQAKYGLQGGMYVIQNIFVPQDKRMILINVEGELNDQDIGSQIFSTFKLQ